MVRFDLAMQRNMSDKKVCCTFEIGEQNRPSHSSGDNSSSVLLDHGDHHHSNLHSNRSSPKNTTTPTFPWQLHSLLEAAEREGFDHIVSWLDNTTFKVHDPGLFVKLVMPRYFKRQSKYKSFQRQLNLWQFQRVTRSRGLCCKSGYFHAYFHRHNTSLFHCMKRSTFNKQRSTRGNDDPLYLLEDCLEMHQGESAAEERGIKCTGTTTQNPPRDVNASYATYPVSQQNKVVDSERLLLDWSISKSYHQVLASGRSSPVLCSYPTFSILHDNLVNLDASNDVQYSNKLAQHLLLPPSHLGQKNEEIVFFAPQHEDNHWRKDDGELMLPSLDTVHHAGCSSCPKDADSKDGDEKSMLEESITTEGGMEGGSHGLSATEWKYVLIGIEMAMTA